MGVTGGPMMSERVPIQQAIEDLESRIELAESTGLKDSPIDMYNRGELEGLRKVESGRIVTAKRAALEAMAEKPCQDISGELCEITMPGDPVHWCHPCGCRHALETTT